MSALRLSLLWMGAYLLLSVAMSWPLPLHVSTHLTGPPSGDTGVYAWNMWVFHHELVQQQSTPLRTGTVMALAPAADLTLHNYTVFMNILALPLLAWIGLVATFNIVYLGLMALTAWCTALLTRRAGAAPFEAWLAGVAFAWSPILVARSTAHFSLVAAAPLPVLLLCFIRGSETRELKYAVAAGATLAWALFCDVYFAVFGALLTLCWVAAQAVVVSRGPGHAAWMAWLTRVADGLIVLTAAFVTATAVKGGIIEVVGVRISVRTLYTPVLVLTALVVVRLLLAWRPRFSWRARLSPFVVRWAAAGLATMAFAMAPVLFAYGSRMLDGTLDNPGIFWRSSPPGVDLLAFVMPNPNHAWFGEPFREWIVARRADGFAELTGSLSLVTLGVIATAWWRCPQWRPRRRWLWMPGVFAALSLGPFVTVAGMNTYVPGPWAVLRYMPVIGLARSPSRFTVVLALLVAVLFGLALTALTQSRPAIRRLVLGVVTALLLFELAPIPRPLYAGTVPAVFHRIADDPRSDIRVLALPFGLRDGTSSLGAFNPLTQYQQTVHGKPLVGGYLSRLTAEQKRFHRRFPVLHALMTGSEQRPISDEERARAFDARDEFLDRARIGYVVINERDTAPELRAFAVDLLRLRCVDVSDGYSLHVPGDAPAHCDEATLSDER